jgi:DNA mismatch repair protein MutS
MIIDDYLNYQDEYKAKYGENTIILIQVGSFFELYSINENCTFMYKIADICNIQVSRKNKSIKEVSKNNPLMAGFPLYVLNKFIQLLLNNNFTIVLIEQITPPPNPERKITEIVSPSTNFNITTNKSNYIIVFYFEEIIYNHNNQIIVGISGVDLTTGKSFIYESKPESTIDECYRLLTSYNPSEILICSENLISENYKKQIIGIIESSNALVHKKWDKYELKSQIKKIDYQNKILEKSFENNSILSIIEFLNLERYSIGRISFCACLQFAYEHNADIIKDLNLPELLEQSSILTIEYNSAIQLNIISNNNNERPLIDILNRCSTAFGSRRFKERLLNPINNIEKLNNRYNKIEELLKDNKFKEINKYLRNILDLERIKRKIILNKFNPCEFSSFISSLENAIHIFNIDKNDLLITILNKIMNDLSILNLDECSKYNINDIKSNIFIKGYIPDIDELSHILEEKIRKLNDITDFISLIDDTNAKLEFNEREGYYISITKRRYDTAYSKNRGYMSVFEKKINGNNNNIKLVSKEINEISDIIQTTENKITSIIIKRYLEFLSTFINKNKSSLELVINYLTELDINVCNARNAFDYHYYKPEIINDNNNSYLNAEDLRHPIIERISNDIEYIGNDISLNQNGLLLFGINASGKSSLMKAVGLAIIMGQSGMYVPASSFKFYPYSHIMTRICGNDNIYRGMSSFVVEMTELRNILQRADKSSLIIGDEICSGTEAISGVSIVSSAIYELINKKASFIFTSHLHELTSVSLLKDKITEGTLRIFHIHIKIEGDKIIYERKLKEGQGSAIYGIDVCSSLNMPDNFMKNAEKVRKEIQGLNEYLINPKNSNYNSGIYMDLCQVCKINKATETHHINYQINADNNGNFDNFNKNEKHNLITICEECHKKEHKGEIGIIGFKQTNKGKVLDIDNKGRIHKLIKFNGSYWSYRNRINSKWQPINQENLIIFYNKQMKNQIKEITAEMEKDFYDI